MRAVEHDEYIIIIAILFLCFDLTFLQDKKCIEVAFCNHQLNLHKRLVLWQNCKYKCKKNLPFYNNM